MKRYALPGIAVMVFLAAGARGQEKPSGDVLRVHGLVGFSLDNGIRSCALSPDGKRLALGQNHFRLAMCDLSTLLREKS